MRCITDAALTVADAGIRPFFVLCNALVERVKGIEPSYAAWEAAVLPLNYTRSA